MTAGGAVRGSRRVTSSVGVVTVGLLGAVLMAAGSYWTAAVPAWFRTAPPAVIAVMSMQAPPARIAYYAGLLLFLVAWLTLGHRVLYPDQPAGDPSVRVLRRAALLWSAPLLLSVPLASRDLWAYVAQAEIAALGRNPYTNAPAAIGGAFAANITPRWVDTPSPYGPLWTLLGRPVNALTGDHLLTATLLFRVISSVGLVLLTATVPALAARLGGSPRLAAWAVLAGPLTVVHGVGGGHNDLLMVGLTSVALWLTVFAPGPGWRVLLLAGIVVGVASAVKFPAVVAVPFLPLLRAEYGPSGAHPVGTAAAGWRATVARRVPQLLPGLSAAVAGYLLVVGLASYLGGFGLSWLGSISTADHGGGPAGSALLAVALVALWVVALRYPPVAMLALALLVVSLASRFSLAWYWLWPVSVAALIRPPRWLVIVFATISVDQVLFIRPNGQSLLVRPELIIAVALLLVWLVLDGARRPGAIDPETARAPTGAG